MKLCLVTGATGGIGRATSLQLAAMDAELYLVSRSRERGADTVAENARAVTGFSSCAPAARRSRRGWDVVRIGLGVARYGVAGFVGVHHELRSVPAIEFGQQIAYVCLDGAVSEVELGRDLLIGRSPRHG